MLLCWKQINKLHRQQCSYFNRTKLWLSKYFLVPHKSKVGLWAELGSECLQELYDTDFSYSQVYNSRLPYLVKHINQLKHILIQLCPSASALERGLLHPLPFLFCMCDVDSAKAVWADDK